MRCDVWLVNQDKQNTYTEGGHLQHVYMLKKEHLQPVYRRKNIFNRSIEEGTSLTRL